MKKLSFLQVVSLVFVAISLVAHCSSPLQAEQEPTKASSCQISGVVLDPLGNPVSEANCRLVNATNPKNVWRLDSDVETNARGEFMVTNLSEGKYQIEVRHNDWCGVRTPAVSVTATVAPEPLTIKLVEGSVATGRVMTLRDGKPSPVEGLIVCANEKPDPSQPYTVGPFRNFCNSPTNAQGEFTFEGLAPGRTYFAYASNSQWNVEQSVEFVVPQQGNAEGIELSMPPEGIIRGVVLDAKNKPIAGAKVEAVSSQLGFGSRQLVNGYSIAAPLDTRTADDGSFEVGKLNRDKRYYLLVTASDHAPLATEAFPATGDQLQRLTLSIGATLGGKVIDDAGKPVAGKRVRISPVSSKQFGTLAWTVKTDENGEFALPHMADSTYRLRGVWSDDESTLVISRGKATLRHGMDSSVELHAHAAVTVRGTVQDDRGQPMSGASVRIETHQYVEQKSQHSSTPDVITDEEGRFEVTGLEHGELHGNARKQGYIGSDPFDHSYMFYGGRTRKPLALAQPGELIEDAVIVLKRSPKYEPLSTTGFVVDQQHNLMPEVQVSLYYESGWFNRSVIHRCGNSTLTNDRGEFAFENERGGAVGLVVMPTVQKPYYGRAILGDDTIQLEQCGSVRGVVVDDLGKPIAEATVYANPKNPFMVYSQEAPRSVQTDGEGRFEFPLLRRGECGFYCSKQDYATLERKDHLRAEIVSGEQIELPNLSLESLREKKFRGLLVDQNGQPLADWRVTSGKTAKDGSFEYILKQGANTLGFHNEQGDYETGIRVHYTSGPIDFPRQQPADEQKFVVSTGGLIRGKLLVAETDQPHGIVQAEVMIDYQKRPTSNRFGEAAPRSIHTKIADLLQPDGSFVLSGFPVGHCIITVTGDELAETMLPVYVDDTGVADLGVLRLPQSRTVTGKLVGPDGEVISSNDYELRIEGRLSTGERMPRSSVALAYDGEFRIGRLPKDVERLTFLAIEKSSWNSAQSPNRLSLVGFRDQLDFGSSTSFDFGELRVKPYEVQGRFLDKATGQPPKLESPASIRVIAETSNVFELRRYLGQDKLDADGSFRLEQYRPDFETLRIERRGYLPIIFRGPRVEAPDGLIELGAIEFDQGLTLRGVLRGPNGEAVYRAGVNIKIGDDYSQYCTTDDEGNFEVSGIRPGNVDIYATATRQREHNTWVKAKPQGISRVNLHRAGFEILEGKANFVELAFPSHEPE